MKVTSFEQLLKTVRGKPKRTVALAMAHDPDALAAVAHANKEGIADAVLVGPRRKIVECSEKHEIDISAFDIMNANTEIQAVSRSIQLVREQLADSLMKGACSSATLLRGVLDKERGVRAGRLLSHVAVFEVPRYPKLLIMSDGGMNILPDMDAKLSIIENAVQAAHRLGVRNPKVALLAALEKVNYSAMPCTVDAAVISKMYQRGQIKDAIIDGPLALDNAVSHRACEVKGIVSEVGGDADILIVPNIETGNVLYKALAYLGDARVAGIILGAKVPIILTSRADTQEAKFYSIAFGMQISGKS